MKTATEMASEQIAREDQGALAQRINYRAREIQHALDSISYAHQKRHSSVTLTFSCDAEAKHIHSALTELGYSCSGIETRRGEWLNSEYHDYIIDVQLVAKKALVD